MERYITWTKTNVGHKMTLDVCELEHKITQDVECIEFYFTDDISSGIIVFWTLSPWALLLPTLSNPSVPSGHKLVKRLGLKRIKLIKQDLDL